MKGHLLGKEEKGLDRMVAEPTCRRELALGYCRRHQAVGCPRAWQEGSRGLTQDNQGSLGCGHPNKFSPSGGVQAS